MTVINGRELDATLGELLSRLTAVYGERLRSLHLFGSYARNEAGPESDVDVLVVLDEVPNYMAEVRRTGGIVSSLSLAHAVTISPVFVSERAWEAAATPFLQNVREEGRRAA
ncbi:MAG: nucleotidyltransferase domain-containing protein [Gemmatimonadota bacterium]